MKENFGCTSFLSLKIASFIAVGVFVVVVVVVAVVVVVVVVFSFSNLPSGHCLSPFTHARISLSAFCAFCWHEFLTSLSEAGFKGALLGCLGTEVQCMIRFNLVLCFFRTGVVALS